MTSNVGLNTVWSSRVPTKTMMIPGSPSPSFTTPELQFGQNCLRTIRPESPARSNDLSSPCKLTEAAGNIMNGSRLSQYNADNYGSGRCRSVWVQQ